MQFRFGECLLDTDVRELKRRGQPVKLKPKGFRLLEILLEHRPNALSQEQLGDALWPDVETGGTTLARLVSDVRSAIDDRGGEQGLIRTVHRFGYAFRGRVQEEHAASSTQDGKTAYAIQWERQLVPLAQGENLIGRTDEARLSIPSPEVSRRHARIVVGDQATLEDLGSRNGTYLAGRRVTEAVRLKHRDRIAIGPALLLFYVAADEETADTPDQTGPTP